MKWNVKTISVLFIFIFIITSVLFYSTNFHPEEQKRDIDDKIKSKDLSYNYSNKSSLSKIYYSRGNKVATDTLNDLEEIVKRDYFKERNGKKYATSFFDKCGNLIGTSYYDDAGNLTGSVIPHLSPVCTVTGL